MSAAIALAVLVVVIKVASEWLAATDGITDRAKRAEEIGRARTVVLALLAGGLAAIGAYYTHRNFGLNRQGQITERFTRAVGQLGNDSSDVRLGGIYALERLARESQLDHGPIIEILTAFVRERAEIPDEEDEQRRLDYESHIYPSPPSVDVQATLTVLGRRNLAFDPGSPWHLDLAGVYLPKANLRNATLRGADLSYAVLDLADMSAADLGHAKLEGTRLTGANLTRAELLGADLQRAHDRRRAELGVAVRGESDRCPARPCDPARRVLLGCRPE